MQELMRCDALRLPTCSLVFAGLPRVSDEKTSRRDERKGRRVDGGRW